VSYQDRHRGRERVRAYEDLLASPSVVALWEAVERPLLVSILADLRARGVCRVLDFACGTGRITRLLEDHFPTVVGVDVSPEMMAVAQRRCPRSRFLSPEEWEEEGGASFDLVTAFRFFANAEAELRGEALARMGRSLTGEGRLLCNNHLNGESPWGRVSRLFPRRSVAYWPDGQARAFFARAGWRLEASWGLGLLPLRRGRLLPPGWRAAAEERLVARGRWGRWHQQRIYLLRRIGGGRAP